VEGLFSGGVRSVKTGTNNFGKFYCLALMETSLRFATTAVSALLLVSGCGSKNVNELSPAQAAAFDQASPEVKDMWLQASEAVKTNGYVTAYNLCYDLVNVGLTADQKEAVTKLSASLNDRLLAAVDKGDPAAQSAMEEMRRNPPSRRRAN